MDLPEILTIEEVARYLRVSERTVYDWAQKGELPAGKLGSSWRFKRADIVRWTDERIKADKRDLTPPGIRFREIVRRERIIFLREMDKNGALLELVDCLAAAEEITDREELTRAIFRREELMSTGIGLGIAVPHVRLESGRGLVMAIGVSRAGIRDYESLDGSPVHIVCMIATGRYDHAQYLRVLAEISRRLRDRDFRGRILAADDPEQIFDLLVGPGVEN